MLTITGKAIGRRRPLFEGFSVPPPDDRGDGGPLTLRDLIVYVVHAEVAAFEERREARRLDRVLSPERIDEAAARGKVDPAGRDPKLGPSPKVDAESAAAAALEAFTDGLYLVAIDGVEYRDLDAIVRLEPDSRLTFIRLTFLAGA